MSTLYNSQEVADRIREVAKLRSLTMKEVLEDCGLGFNLMTNMRTSWPRADNIGKIADRLECSVDYLLGRTTEMLTAGTGQVQPGTSRNAAEMLALYIQLPEREQLILLGRLQEMVSPTASDQAGGKKEASSRETEAVAG